MGMSKKTKAKNDAIMADFLATKFKMGYDFRWGLGVDGKGPIQDRVDLLQNVLAGDKGDGGPAEVVPQGPSEQRPID
ncbi:MAG TPA: hypothetical protein VN455_08295 [Methanotrichaceae archaeon]|nr:hypothetical protein [Methanotrichaceae archaeon]